MLKSRPELTRSLIPGCSCLIPRLSGLIRAHALSSSSRLNAIFVKHTNNGLGRLILCCTGCWDEQCTLAGLFTEWLNHLLVRYIQVQVFLLFSFEYLLMPVCLHDLHIAYSPQLGARLNISYTQLNFIGLAGNGKQFFADPRIYFNVFFFIQSACPFPLRFGEGS